MRQFTELLALAVLVLVGALLAKLARHSRSQALTCLELRFPRELDGDAVTSFLVGLCGLLPPWWRRWLNTPTVVLELIGTSQGIRHRVLAPAQSIAVIGQQLQAGIPGVRYERIASTAVGVDQALEYRLSTMRRPLRIDATGISTKLLTSLQPLGAGESVVVQWVLTPAGPTSPVSISPTSRRPSPWLSAPTTTVDGEAASALRAKQAHPLLLACPRVGVCASNPARRVQLLRQTEVAWHGTRAPGVHLRRRFLPSAIVVSRMQRRSTPLVEWPALLNVEELAGLPGWPIGVSQLPGLVLAGCRQLSPSPLVPSRGTVVADSTYPRADRALALDVEARLRHVHVLGPTGTGKSTLLANMVVSDLNSGRGVVVVDAKGDLIDDVLARVPESRRSDVVVLDPADTRPVGLNPLAVAAGARGEVVVENLVGLFKSLYRSSWGPRTDDILRAALMTLARHGDATLCEVPLLLSDASYRRRVVGRLDDPVGLEGFWGWYEALSDAERSSVVGPVLNKVRAFTMRPTVRSIVGQASPAIDMSEVLASDRVLLVSLASGVLGDEAAALLGALVVAELWRATTARAALPPESRRPVMAYLDEWQQFMHLPTPMAAVLAQARGLGLGLTLAHQHLDQVPADVRSAVLSNARSRVVFQLPAADARIVARELGGLLDADDLTGLGPHEVVVSPFAAGATQPPATGRTRPAPAPYSDGAAIRAESRERYGVDRGDVEAAIRARQTAGQRRAPVRRKPKPDSGSTT